MILVIFLNYLFADTIYRRVTSSEKFDHQLCRSPRYIRRTLSRCRMNGDSVVEVLLSGCKELLSTCLENTKINGELTAHLHSDSETLQHFVAPSTDDVHADDAFLWSYTDKLVHGGLLVFWGQHGEIEGAEV